MELLASLLHLINPLPYFRSSAASVVARVTASGEIFAQSVSKAPGNFRHGSSSPFRSSTGLSNLPFATTRRLASPLRLHACKLSCRICNLRVGRQRVARFGTAFLRAEQSRLYPSC